MDPGMVISTPEPEKVLAEAKLHGITTQAIGQITDEPSIRVKNHGTVRDNEWINL